MKNTQLQEAITIAKNYGISVSENCIKSKSRSAAFVFQRAVCALIMHHYGSGVLDIGNAMERSHATSYNLLAYDKGTSSPGYRRKFKKLKAQLLSKQEETKSPKAQKPNRMPVANLPEPTTDSKDIMAKLRYHTEMANHYAQLI